VVSGDEEISLFITVFDVSGKQLFSSKINKKVSINKNFPNGIYIVQVRTPKGEGVYKVML